MSGSGTDFDDVKVKGVDSGGVDREIIAYQDGSIYRLGVDAKFSGVSIPSPVHAFSKNLRYDDMNASTGGVARDTTFSTTWIDVYSYSGSGLVIGFTLTLESLSECLVRLLVDGEEIFGSSGITIDDVINTTAYNMADGKNQPDHGLIRNGLSFRMQLDNPVQYETSVTVKVKRSTGTKKFYAGLMVLTKES